MSIRSFWSMAFFKLLMFADVPRLYFDRTAPDENCLTPSAMAIRKFICRSVYVSIMFANKRLSCPMMS